MVRIVYVFRYCQDTFESNYKSTIGVDFEVEKCLVLGQSLNLQLLVVCCYCTFAINHTVVFNSHLILILLQVGHSWC